MSDWKLFIRNDGNQQAVTVNQILYITKMSFRKENKDKRNFRKKKTNIISIPIQLTMLKEALQTNDRQ